MTSNPLDDERPATTEKVVACVLALLIVAGGGVVIVDSLRLGARWASDGPQAGYFPFYIGLMLCASGLVNFFGALRAPYRKTFVTRGQGKLVLLVLVPLIVYVGAIQLLGIYVASTLYIAIFMTWLGKYKWKRTAMVSLGVSIAFFLMFEVWFKVPLIKGPLETALGLN
ncbi:MAG: tripartite tricarboxylate transporter TctB family protein [Betaproteobacteria bacterium]